jgi:hypothetical protein
MLRSSNWSGNHTFNVATRVRAPYGVPSEYATSVLGVAPQFKLLKHLMDDVCSCKAGN